MDLPQGNSSRCLSDRKLHWLRKRVDTMAKKISVVLSKSDAVCRNSSQFITELFRRPYMSYTV
jgi:hypothetical protein